MTWPTASGTGHRHLPNLPWVRAKALAGVRWLAEERGTVEIHSGMAWGWDLMLADAALQVGLRLVAHIPYESQPDRWEPEQRREWTRLRSLASDEVVYGEDPGSYGRACDLLGKRNDGLLKADALVGCWTRQRHGGTWSAIRKAQAMGMVGVHLDPARQRVRVVGPHEWLG